ncbi:ATP synthase subunit mitochondrial [Brachionus plicatilis]|uniref:ATP synthase subunit g n=1 Tax=Brachionus plicatilis TaxID=10195 RepID=A0A3M7QUF1_BRAPC|nr:ATP synthase subunit mitochondrial [Brachionus plicatilis]
MSKLVSQLPKLANGVVEFSQPRLRTFWRYAKVELRPPTPGEIPEVSKGLTELLNSAKTGKWKQLTVKQATVNTMVGLELLMWFFIGEVIGRGTLVGYDVSRVQPKFPLF